MAQRFPKIFDGIVAGAPVLNFSGTMTSFACTAQALAAPVPYAKLATSPNGSTRYAMTRTD